MARNHHEVDLPHGTRRWLPDLFARFQVKSTLYETNMCLGEIAQKVRINSNLIGIQVLCPLRASTFAGTFSIQTAA
jgi:hypothetical protein